MTPIEAMRQALEALECHADIGINADNAITNLRTAIEQMEKAEPVAWWNHKFPSLTIQLTQPSAGSSWEPFYTHPAPIPEGMALVPKEQMDAVVRFIKEVRFAQEHAADQPISMLFACGCRGPMPECACANRSRHINEFLAAAPKEAEK